MNTEHVTAFTATSASKAAEGSADLTPTPSLLERTIVKQETLSVGDFMAIPDHPRQRDTERHLKKALKKHLAHPSPLHQRVSVGVFRGQRFKLDGHTRSLAWEKGLLVAPTVLRVDVYDCESWEDLLELYRHFDNKDAAEDIADKLSGALRQVGLEIKSPAMSKYGFGNALQLASRAFGGESNDVYANVAEFGEELTMLDDLAPSASIFRVGVIAGSILLLRKHGAKIVPFLEALNANAGVKTTSHCDAVHALSDVILRQNKGRAGNSRNLELTGKTISCGERWIKGEKYLVNAKGVGVKSTSLGGYAKRREA